jgi:hypothetical protein
VFFDSEVRKENTQNDANPRAGHYLAAKELLQTQTVSSFDLEHKEENP